MHLNILITSKARGGTQLALGRAQLLCSALLATILQKHGVVLSTRALRKHARAQLRSNCSLNAIVPDFKSIKARNLSNLHLHFLYSSSPSSISPILHLYFPTFY
ncbi:hypothetical protein Csa_005205 [Cucumis sativus]|uniref:Uncharacterized protein n=1 Tax=Cucumis sativus TaxID=3659 RepID=A0A0A0KDY6_CUCSA|nr:hypothetical protein Csa_005205 [Cucumis sativus]